MINNKRSQTVAEIATIILFILFLSPFVLVVINSAKTANEVSRFPLAWPENWGNLFANIVTIWKSPNINYASSL